MFKSFGFSNKMFLASALVGLGIVIFAILQQLQNREIVRSCTAIKHKVIYVQSPLGDQALCVNKELMNYLLKNSLKS